eukprot:TRINITY_DN1658_c0_g1_i4.p1 TRINITY_DN1658_c0_g1~~TRINITY_DN1658_c0_g1_i4.p1  ORF type:complete len:302 (+),score=49.17 TRINITY_DN1658_c0_g1_i4:163-1068(+)
MSSSLLLRLIQRHKNLLHNQQFLQRFFSSTQQINNDGQGMRKRPAFVSSVIKLMATGVVTVPLLSSAIITYPASKKLGIWFVRKWAQVVLRIFSITVKVEDRTKIDYSQPPYIFLNLNQTSLIETLVWLVASPVWPFYLVANFEYLLIPFMGWFFSVMGSVWVVRQWTEQAKRAVEKSIQKLQNGESCYMSIEGKRSPTGELSPYKRGAVIMAIDSQSTIIPLIHHGARECLPYGEWRVSPGEVRLKILPPIPTKGLTRDDRIKLTDQLRNIAERELNNKNMNNETNSSNNENNNTLHSKL